MQNILIVVDMQNDFIDGALARRSSCHCSEGGGEDPGFDGKVFSQGIPMKRIIWRHRRGKTFRFLTVSGAQLDGRFGKNWTP